MTMSAAPIPTALYEGILGKVVEILDLIHKGDGASTHQSKQAIRNAVREPFPRLQAPESYLSKSISLQANDLKESLNEAKGIASDLPGGEMCIEDQDEVLDMLSRARNRKR